jgi:hypothetical protein
VSARPRADSPISSPPGDIEARLAKAFEVEPTPAQLAAIDGRVSPALFGLRRIEAEPAPRRIGRSRRRWGSVLLAAAALVILVGVVGARATLQSMYPLSTQGNAPLVWDRSTKLGLSQVRNGYNVTLDAAYVDAAQAMLAISVVDAETGRESQIMVGTLVLTDEEGRAFTTETGIGGPAGGSSVVSMTWLESPGEGTLSGTQHLRLSLPSISVRDAADVAPVLGGDDPWHDVAGPWNFEFDITIAAGASLSPSWKATASGITIELESVVVAPSTVRLTWRYEGLPNPDEGLIPVFTVFHDGTEIPGGMTGSSLLDPGRETKAETETGVDNASGSWTVRIDRLIRPEIGAADTRLEGPWEFNFTLP